MKKLCIKNSLNSWRNFLSSQLGYDEQESKQKLIVKWILSLVNSRQEIDNYISHNWISYTVVCWKIDNQQSKTMDSLSIIMLSNETSIQVLFLLRT